MKIYDISQEVFSCAVYPGDPAPEREILLSMKNGGPYTLSAFRMCCHNGTHIDAPAHFLKEGKTVEQFPPEAFTGAAFVVEHQGTITADQAAAMVRAAAGADHLLIKGPAVVSLEAAKVFAEAPLRLLGNESQSVGPEDAPMAVHLALLQKDILLLEGIRLEHVPPGHYLLCAAPLNLAGCEGAPCRAILMEA